MLTGTETAHWLYNIAPVQCYRGTHYNTTPFPQFNDAPRTQDFDLEKTLTGFIKVNAVALGGAAVAGFVMGGPAGAGAAVLKTMLVITPATASVAVGDIISGEASSLGTYILAAAEAATIYALTLGIETGIMKLMLRSNNPAMFYAGSILGAGASGFAVDTFTQFMTQNGEVDWERALKVGMFSAAVDAALLTLKYGILGHENPVITAQKQQAAFEKYLANGIDESTAKRLSIWPESNRPSPEDYLKHRSVYDNPFVFDQQTGKFIATPAPDLLDHINEVKNYSKKGFSGGHNMGDFLNNFEAELKVRMEGRPYNLNDFLVIRKHPTMDGIYEITYCLPSIDGSKPIGSQLVIPVQKKSFPYPKTVFNPYENISAQSIYDSAMNSDIYIVDNDGGLSTVVDGVTYGLKLDYTTGQVNSTYPYLTEAEQAIAELIKLEDIPGY